MTKLFSLFSSKEIHIKPGEKIISAREFSKAIGAKEILEQVHEDALQYKKEVALEAEKVKEQAFEKGFQEGLASLNKHLIKMDDELKRVKKEIQEKILPLSILAGRKILGEELKLHPDRIVDIIRTALKPITQSKRVTIYISRQDLEIVELNRPKIKEIFQHLENLSLQERDDIEPGGCMIETESGIINAQIESQWRALESAFESFKET